MNTHSYHLDSDKLTLIPNTIIRLRELFLICVSVLFSKGGYHDSHAVRTIGNDELRF